MDKKLVEHVQRLRKEGKSYGDIAKELLITKSQACYYNKIDINECENKKSSHDKYVRSVCDLAKKCTNINQILKILGKKSVTEYYKEIRKILEDNNVDTSHFVEDHTVIEYEHPALETKDYLVKGSTIASCKLRNKIIKEGIKEHKCECCGLTEWQDKPIPLQLHHINGDKTDNRLENLQLLCPNCHAFTDNYCGRKLKKESNKCKICGKEILRNSTYCSTCYNEYIKTKTKNGFKNETFKNRNNQNIKYPTKEELINDFKEIGSFRGVGKKYGLSDKAIVRWCIKYELPVKSMEMRHYIKNMFGDIKWKITDGNPKALLEYNKNKFKKIGLLDDDNNVIKTYSSVKELIDDGFIPQSVHEVCKGIAKTHHKMKFKFI